MCVCGLIKFGVIISLCVLSIVFVCMFVVEGCISMMWLLWMFILVMNGVLLLLLIMVLLWIRMLIGLGFGVVWVGLVSVRFKVRVDSKYCGRWCGCILVFLWFVVSVRSFVVYIVCKWFGLVCGMDM